MTDIFQQPYYRINKFLLCCIGQWPYQTRAKRFLLLAFLASITTLQATCHMLAIVKYQNFDVITETTPPIVIFSVYSLKILNGTFNSEKLLKMFQRIEIDWIFVAQQPEMYILRGYAEKTKQLTIVIIVGMCLPAILYMSQPFLPGFQKVMEFSNETTSKRLPLPIDFFGLDVDVYYYYMLTYMWLVLMYGVLVAITMESTFILLVQHACGMFTVVGHQLQRMTNDITEEIADINSQPKLEPSFGHLIIYIKKHKDVIEFSDILRAFYAWVSLPIHGLTVLVIGVTGVQLIFMIDKNPKGAVRFVMFSISVIGHHFVLSLFSQKLLDHSQQISDYLCQAQWYKTSLATQKLLNFVIMRAHVPCQLTAGKTITMSMEHFVEVFKRSMAYFTVMRSVQEML